MSDAPAPAKKSKKGFLMIVILLLVAAGGGGGAYFFYFKAPKAHAKTVEAEHEPEPEPEPEGPKGIVPMEPFVVNLADAGAARFLRANLSLIVSDEEHAKELEENEVDKARIRSTILELLAQQHADKLVTPEGKDELKKTIAERVAHAVHGMKVADVLFSEFVIQF
jgi:flagellar FliL protein